MLRTICSLYHIHSWATCKTSSYYFTRWRRKQFGDGTPRRVRYRSRRTQQKRDFKVKTKTIERERIQRRQTTQSENSLYIWTISRSWKQVQNYTIPVSVRKTQSCDVLKPDRNSSKNLVSKSAYKMEEAKPGNGCNCPNEAVSFPPSCTCTVQSSQLLLQLADALLPYTRTVQRYITLCACPTPCDVRAYVNNRA